MRNVATTAAILALLGVGVAGCNPEKAMNNVKKKADAAAKKAGDKAVDAAADAAADAAKEAVSGDEKGKEVNYTCAMDGCDKTKVGNEGDVAPQC